MSRLLFLLIFIWISPKIIFGDCAIVSRSQWGARSPRAERTVLRENPPPYVIVHHSETPQCNSLQACTNRVKNIQDYHMDHNKWEDIGYNFLIGTDGTIFEGRGWGVTGAHAPKFNSISIGICLIGSYQSVSPPEIQLTALKKLISYGVSSGNILSFYGIMGHRQVTSTNCPGDKLYELLTKMDRYVQYYSAS